MRSDSAMKSKWLAVFFVILILCLTGCSKAPVPEDATISECPAILIL